MAEIFIHEWNKSVHDGRRILSSKSAEKIAGQHAYACQRLSSWFRLGKYIIKHDEAKKIIADDYRKLPQNTRKEKKYYEIARKRDHRQKRRQLYNLLDCISRGETPANKWVAIC